ncbi:hypothetical protein [Neorhizobium huautlense]|uniref:hypothetical protein n=1 Tax=Neorhizobium huautlense TaxID=67774 RepID=UPI000CFA4D40|nr:hypothetical protein [Neorhizobium huautlense]
MKTSFSVISAMIAATAFAGSALAEGDYFEGTAKTQVSAKVDNVRTGSIGEIRVDGRNHGQPIFEKTNRDNR